MNGQAAPGDISGCLRSADEQEVLPGNPAILLGLSGLLGFLALVCRRPRAAGALLVLIAAALFGTAVGARAASAELLRSPLPPGLRFVLMASFGTFAFHRSWSWLRQKMTPPPLP